jgi:hypothetical protein
LVMIWSRERPHVLPPETRKGRVCSPFVRSGRGDSNSRPLVPQVCKASLDVARCRRRAKSVLLAPVSSTLTTANRCHGVVTVGVR